MGEYKGAVVKIQNDPYAGKLCLHCSRGSGERPGKSGVLKITDANPMAK